MKEILEELNPWWKNEYGFDSFKREKYFEMLLNQIEKKDITILTGIRRVGKTTLLKQLIIHLIEKKVNPKHILFISLDILFFKPFNIYDIILEYKKINNIEHKEKIFLFLDEVTYKENFNQELKNLYDLGNYKIFASSSSAKVLKDKKAFLTGRARYTEINPLDFKEYIIFKSLDIKKIETHILENLFEEYMIFGGMPEYVLTKDPTYLSELLELIISKDIISLNNLKNKELVYDLFKLLCERIGKQISYNKISKILNVDNQTIAKYVSFFLDTYLFDIIEMKGKLNERLKAKKKLYCIDMGLKNVVTGFRDKGAIYENLVYRHIKNNKPNFLFKDGIEIDFCFKNTLIEAKYGQELTTEQKKLFDSSKFEKKIIAKGVDFFLKENF
jgi:uncharacterized protein